MYHPQKAQFTSVMDFTKISLKYKKQNQLEISFKF
jgi:hypothetical protein